MVGSVAALVVTIDVIDITVVIFKMIVPNCLLFVVQDIYFISVVVSIVLFYAISVVVIVLAYPVALVSFALRFHFAVIYDFIQPIFLSHTHTYCFVLQFTCHVLEFRKSLPPISPFMTPLSIGMFQQPLIYFAVTASFYS